ncbi:MAG: hypothetical protein MMC33_006905 [Icmadophila ericetorum]|nr:hypothetical protein [Icmadophila ericetorum]
MDSLTQVQLIATIISIRQEMEVKYQKKILAMDRRYRGDVRSPLLGRDRDKTMARTRADRKRVVRRAKQILAINQMELNEKETELNNAKNTLHNLRFWVKWNLPSHHPLPWMMTSNNRFSIAGITSAPIPSHQSTADRSMERSGRTSPQISPPTPPQTLPLTPPQPPPPPPPPTSHHLLSPTDMEWELTYTNQGPVGVAMMKAGDYISSNSSSTFSDSSVPPKYSVSSNTPVPAKPSGPTDPSFSPSRASAKIPVTAKVALSTPSGSSRVQDLARIARANLATLTAGHSTSSSDSIPYTNQNAQVNTAASLMISPHSQPSALSQTNPTSALPTPPTLMSSLSTGSPSTPSPAPPPPPTQQASLTHPPSQQHTTHFMPSKKPGSFGARKPRPATQARPSLTPSPLRTFTLAASTPPSFT